MPDTLPKFDRPPIVETVLSAQFSRLSSFRAAHAGSFWELYLSDWKSVQETGRIQDTFERFGDALQWGQMGFMFSPSPEVRTQILSPDQSRMLQLQDSRFIYNWKKAEGEYLSFEKSYEEFTKHYVQLKQFLLNKELGKVDENQWEVQYINHLIKGDLWQSPEDWQRIFPWLNFPPAVGSKPDYLQCSWSSVINGHAGRLHTSLAFARTALNGPEALILTLTARGEVSQNSNASVEAGLNIGHETIVRSFAEMTSEWAHGKWERRQ
jgi:uncharacterized protein (TIGR04255 family)